MQFFSSNGVRIAYVDLAPTGEDRGEPILLIHGFASNHAVNWSNTLWTKTLTHDGRRVIALDNRGHGQSEKLYEPAQYTTSIMARDAVNLLDHLGIERADVMGYSMGARITAFMALEHAARLRARSWAVWATDSFVQPRCRATSPKRWRLLRSTI